MIRSKLIAVLNLLSDELQAHAAAHALSQIAASNNKLIADYIIETLQIPEPSLPPPTVREGEGVWIYARIIAQTFKAILVEAEGWEQDDATWFPLSRIKTRKTEDGLQVWIPLWLLRAKKLERWINPFSDVGS